MLKTVLRKAMDNQGLSSHAAAKAVGVSHHTILRVLRGDIPGVDNTIKFANFLGVRPSELIDSMSEQSTLANDLAVLLEHSPELESVLSGAVQQVKDGTLSPDALREVIAFAKYKFQGSQGETQSYGSRTTARIPRGGRKTQRSR